jgi:hypothetical protein
MIVGNCALEVMAAKRVGARHRLGGGDKCQAAGGADRRAPYDAERALHPSGPSHAGVRVAPSPVAAWLLLKVITASATSPW